MPTGSSLAVLPSPDFACDLTDGCVFAAGIRPYREETFRLESQQLGNKLIVHNYGHGGAGITMSWGCADFVLKTIRASFAPSPAHPIAVLGAGVMGLTASTLLHQAGYSIKIYAEKLSGTTSDIAGGQWAPSIVNWKPTEEANALALLKAAYDTFRNQIGSHYGVSERTNYCKRRGPSLEKIAGRIIPPAQRLARLPFARLNSPGFAYETLLVEPPIFLNRLRTDLRGGVPFIQQKFKSERDVLRLTEPIIVNCTGFGSRSLFNDGKMKPFKGHLVLLKAQPQLKYLYSTDSTYVFPRADHVVVGGSNDIEDDETVDPDRCRDILALAVGVFEGRAFVARDREPWMLKGK